MYFRRQLAGFVAGLMFYDVDFNIDTDLRRPLIASVFENAPIYNVKAGDKMAVVRAIIPMSSIPIWIPTMDLNPGNNGLQTVYQMRLGTFTETIQFISERENFIPTALTNAGGQPADERYFIYNIQTILQMLNNAILALITAVGAPAGTAGNFTFENNSLVFNCFPYSWWSNDANKLMFSHNFRNYLTGFNIKTGPDNFDQLLVISNAINFKAWQNGQWSNPLDYVAGTNPWTAPDNAIIRMQSQAICTSFLAISQILITTDLNIAYETSARYNSVVLPTQTVPVIIGGQTVQALLGAQASQSLQILSDFVPDIGIDGSTSINDVLIYNNPNFVVGRTCEFLSNSVITSFNLAYFWIDRFGIMRQLYSNSAQEIASVKLVFL